MRQETKGDVEYSINDKSLKITIEPMFDKYHNFEIERVWEVLGDHDVIEINEINPGVINDYALSDGENVYFITPSNWRELRDEGQTILEYQGNIDEFIDETFHSHRDFKDWLGR